MYTDHKSYDGKVFLLDVTSDEFLENPYRFYKERYEVSPVIQIQKDVWSITSYDIMSQVLSHPQTGRLGNMAQANPEMEKIRQANPILQIINNWMLFKNPPDHTRLRKLVSSAFTPSKIRQLEPMMRQSIQELIDDIKKSSGEQFDLVSSISYPFPVSIISHMMGIPPEDRSKFRSWSQDFAIALARDVTTLPDKMRHRLNSSAAELISYFKELIAERDGTGNDLVSTLIRAGDEDERLSTEEILSNCTLLLVAGHETTTSLISNGMNALMQHPEQYELLRSDQNLIPPAVEEFLRYDAPVQSVGRFVFEDIEINGHEFRKGDHLSTILGASGRDPEVNPRPDVFDVTREEINHLAFAKGIHYCLGASLARMEAKIAFEEIISNFSNLQFAGVPRRNRNWLLRGFAELSLQYPS